MEIKFDRRYVSEKAEEVILQDWKGYWDEFLKYLRIVEPEFTIDDNNADILVALYEWCLGITSGGDLPDDRRLDPTLGLLFLGKPGTGKTVMMRGVLKFIHDNIRPGDRFFSRILTNSGTEEAWLQNEDKLDFTTRRADDICTQFCYEGAMGVWDYKNAGHVFIDELGSETIIDNGHTVMRTILLGRYENWQKYKHRYGTYITTHLTLPEIERRYGRSVVERLAQMCNLVEFPGESRRPYAFDLDKYLAVEEASIPKERPDLTAD